jgi:hypothetical protein
VPELEPALYASSQPAPGPESQRAQGNVAGASQLQRHSGEKLQGLPTGPEPAYRPVMAIESARAGA